MKNHKKSLAWRKLVRLRKKHTQAEIGAAVGVSQMGVSHYETRFRKPREGGRVRKMFAKKFDVRESDWEAP